MPTSQIDFIHYLHQIRGPFLDNFIKLFDFFDRQEFLFVLLPVIWLGYSWRFGIKLFYLFSLSYLVNFVLKSFFALPRPFHVDPALGIIQVSGYGFPSGSAQTAIFLSGLLIIYWKNKWKWVVALTYALLLSFSRVYLGVHFPIDILGGWIVGFLLLGTYLLIFPKIERFFQNLPSFNALFLSQFLLLTILIWLPSKTVMSIYACSMGLGIGIFINSWANLYMTSPKNKWEFLIRILLGISGVFLIYNLGLKIVPLQSSLALFVLFLSIGLWISSASVYICSLVSTLFVKKRDS